MSPAFGFVSPGTYAVSRIDIAAVANSQPATLSLWIDVNHKPSQKLGSWNTLPIVPLIQPTPTTITTGLSGANLVQGRSYFLEVGNGAASSNSAVWLLNNTGVIAPYYNPPFSNNFPFVTAAAFSIFGNPISATPGVLGVIFPSVSPQSQAAASFVGAFFQSASQINSYTAAQQAYYDCLSSTTAQNCDALGQQYAQQNQMFVANSKNLGTQAESVVNLTGFNPLNAAEVVGAALDGTITTLFNNVVDFFDAINGDGSQANKGISINDVTGTLSGFRIGNKQYTYSNLDITATLDVAEISNLSAGQTYFNDTALFPNGLALGDVTINSVIDPPELGTVSFHLEQLDISAIPEPSTWAMFVFGFGAIGIGLRRRRVAAVP